MRSFNVVDDGTDLSIENVTTTPEVDAYRRRDLNVYPVIRPGTGQQEGLVVLSGVFTESFGAWTVPVEIDAQGQPTMADPESEDTFKQGFNGYHSAKLGLYSATADEMHELLFGGISLQFYDPATGSVQTDPRLPFVNDITSVVIAPDGSYSQHYVGEFPEIADATNERLRFGANAEFFRAEGIAAYANGVIDLDAITETTTLGFIYGGLTANGPHTRGFPNVVSSASNTIFEVVFEPVPEPTTLLLCWVPMVMAVLCRRQRCRTS